MTPACAAELVAATAEKVWAQRGSLQPEQLAHLELLLRRCVHSHESRKRPDPQHGATLSRAQLAGTRISYEGFSLVRRCCVTVMHWLRAVSGAESACVQA